MAKAPKKQGGKGGRKSQNAARKAKRQRHHARTANKKNENVMRSSHGKFKSVVELVAHEAK